MTRLFFGLQMFSEELAEVSPDTSQIATDTTVESSADDGQNTADERVAFEDLIKGDYKDDYKKHVDGLFKKRFKNQRDNQKTLDSIRPGLEMLAQRYGVDPESEEFYTMLNNKIVEDDSYYQEEAFERGLDVATLKELKQTERENQELTRRLAEQQQNIEDQRKFEYVNSQAQEMLQYYPDFDLDAEMEDPEFHRLVWQAGVPVRTAFEVLHKAEIDARMMNMAVAQTKEKMSNEIQSRMSRPREGAMMANSGSLENEKSPKDWTKEERDAIKQRARRGERVSF